MKFIIRDDDLNYFSTPSDIREWYDDLFEQGMPVGFSSIPYVKPISDVYTGTASPEDIEYAISQNQELTAYVRAQSCIDVLQHGTTHETVGGVFEYARIVPRTETLRGREELEHAFDRPVTVFVPPHDWIGSSGVLSVEHANMHILRGRGAGLRNLIPRWRYAYLFFIMLAHKLRYTLRAQVPAYPHVIDFGKHKELCSYRLEDTDVFEGLKYAKEKDGVFVVVTHLHVFDKQKKERLLELIARAREYGAEFVAPSSVFVS